MVVIWHSTQSVNNLYLSYHSHLESKIKRREKHKLRSTTRIELNHSYNHVKGDHVMLAGIRSKASMKSCHNLYAPASHRLSLKAKSECKSYKHSNQLCKKSQNDDKSGENIDEFYDNSNSDPLVAQTDVAVEVADQNRKDSRPEITVPHNFTATVSTEVQTETVNRPPRRIPK